MSCFKEKMSPEGVRKMVMTKKKRGVTVQGYYCYVCQAYHVTSKINHVDGGLVVKRRYSKYKKSLLTAE